jgi:hypothetical protein
MTERHSSLSKKVPTKFGTMHIGISVDDHGRPCGFHIAPAQKLENTKVGELLDVVSMAAAELMMDAIATAEADSAT